MSLTSRTNTARPQLQEPTVPGKHLWMIHKILENNSLGLATINPNSRVANIEQHLHNLSVVQTVKAYVFFHLTKDEN